MNTCADFFDAYLASCKGVSKCHAWTHGPDDLWDSDEIEYGCGALHEISQKAFKNAYRNASKRKVFSIEETSWKVAGKKQFFAKRSSPFYDCHSASFWFNGTECFPANSRRFASFFQFESCRRLMCYRRKNIGLREKRKYDGIRYNVLNV